MENLAEVTLAPEDNWYFSTKCTSCNEVNPNKIYFKLTDVLDLPGSKGQATYIAKCKMCDRQSNLEYVKNTWSAYQNEN